MRVSVNNKEMETSAANLVLLVEELGLPLSGVAVAVNNQIVPRLQWDGYVLSEGLNIVIIKAACGG